MGRRTSWLTAAVAIAATSSARAAEPDGLVLPPGFHASVVATGIKGLRHLAVRPDGDLYASTRGDGGGLVAIHLDRDHRAATVTPFGTVSGGTGLRLHGGWLYASSPTAVYRYRLSPGALVPAGAPETVVDGLPADGFPNRPLAFDAAGGLFVGIGGMGNICADPAPAGGTPAGRNPCPDLATRAGIWRFAADRTNQHFPADGARWATGLRDMVALDWRRGDGLYGVMHGRNGTAATWPARVTAADEDAIGEDLYRLARGTNLGWPYTYFDSARRQRRDAPEYGGTPPAPPAGGYAAPVLSFPAHAAPLDMVFYRGGMFPAAYRGGAFVALHGGLGPDVAEGRSGYVVAFVDLGKAGDARWTAFADHFAGPDAASRTVKRAAYRPVGLAEAPDGALYVADSVKGRIWRIGYSGR